MQDIPVLQVRGKNIAEGYERAIYAVYKNGCEIATQYDKPGDPLSKDCTLNLVIEKPDADPMIHKAFPGGIEDLKEYVMELQGAKDDWVKNHNDPKDTRWEYTYHGRFARYGAWKISRLEYANGESTGKNESVWFNGYYHGDLSDTKNEKTYRCGIDQIEYVIDKLVKQPYTRQAQMITWMPSLDLTCYDPPCLQSIWLRALVAPDGHWILNTNIRIRSNDGWGASFMNIFGLMRFIRLDIADEISKRIHAPVVLGRLNWQADSYHIYGKDIAQCKARLINKIENRHPFENRVYNFRDETIQEMYNGCEGAIIEKVKKESAKMEAEVATTPIPM